MQCSHSDDRVGVVGNRLINSDEDWVQKLTRLLDATYDEKRTISNSPGNTDFCNCAFTNPQFSLR